MKAGLCTGTKVFIHHCMVIVHDYFFYHCPLQVNPALKMLQKWEYIHIKKKYLKVSKVKVLNVGKFPLWVYSMCAITISGSRITSDYC